MKDISIMVGEHKFNYRTALWIERDGKVFVEEKPTIHFTTVPGGRVHTLESSKEALFREIEEEMHLTLKEDEVKLKTVIENFFEYEGVKYHEMYFLYKMDAKEDYNRFIDGLQNYDSENSIYRWVDLDKLEEVNLLPLVLRNLSREDKIEHIIQDDLKQFVFHEN